MTTPEGIKRAAELAAGMGVVYRSTSAVVETVQGEVLWQGAVSEFWGRDCFVYAWAVHGENEPHYVTAKGGAKINSAAAAVRAWLGAHGEAEHVE